MHHRQTVTSNDTRYFYTHGGVAGSQTTSLLSPDPVIMHLVYYVRGDIDFNRGNPGCAIRHNSADAGDISDRNSKHRHISLLLSQSLCLLSYWRLV